MKGSGWGQYLAQYLTLPVSNQAIAGRSARSFTTEGRFSTIINEVVSGDFVGQWCLPVHIQVQCLILETL